MKLRVAFEKALDLVRYTDAITIRRKSGNTCYLCFEHSMTKYGDYDQHRAVIHYTEHIDGEDWRRIKKTSRLYPVENRLNVQSFIYLNPEEEDWHFDGYLPSIEEDLEYEMEKCKSAIRAFEEDLNET